MIGQSISHYRITEKIGEGGMGVVYKARDEQLGRWVAIKCLPPELTSDEGRRARFLHEARTVSALNHPNIVIVHDLLRDATGDYMVMEFVEGRTLDRVIPRGGMPVSEMLALAGQIADALTHGASIIHRDLKPGNVMVTPAGRVKVLDFGLAKPLTEFFALSPDLKIPSLVVPTKAFEMKERRTTTCRQPRLLMAMSALRRSYNRNFPISIRESSLAPYGRLTHRIAKPLSNWSGTRETVSLPWRCRPRPSSLWRSTRSPIRRGRPRHQRRRPLVGRSVRQRLPPGWVRDSQGDASCWQALLAGSLIAESCTVEATANIDSSGRDSSVHRPRKPAANIN